MTWQRRTALVLQVAGLLAVAAAVAALSLVAGIIVAGLALTAFGIALELTSSGGADRGTRTAARSLDDPSAGPERR